MIPLHQVDFKGPSRPVGENQVQFYEVSSQNQPVVLCTPLLEGTYIEPLHSVLLVMYNKELETWFHLLENRVISMVPETRRSLLNSVFCWEPGDSHPSLKCKVMPDTRAFLDNVPVELNAQLGKKVCLAKIQIQNIQWNIHSYGVSLRVKEIHFFSETPSDTELLKILPE